MDANRWKLTAVAGWTVVGALALAGAGGDTEEVVTRRLVIQDGQGRDRIVLGCAAKGEPQVTLMDAAGKARISFALTSQDAPLLSFDDRIGVARILMGLAPGNDIPVLMVQDSLQRHNAQMTAPDGRAEVKIDGHPLGVR